MSGREREWEPQDVGVSATGYICQNELEHPSDLPEVRMKSSPGENCVVCPVCGRRAGGPDDEIPYSDEPEFRTDGGEPTHEQLAAAEWQNVKNWCNEDTERDQ